MKFSIDYTTRWHDTDANRRLRPTAMLVYMQETSNRHTASLGMSLDELRDSKGLAYILSKTRVDFHRMPMAFEDIRVETWTVEARGYSSVRYFRVLSGDETLAQADTVWALVDINNRRLCKHEESGYLFVHDEPIDLIAPSRTRAPADLELTEVGKRSIVYSDLDYNMHMNNTKYADMLCDFLPMKEIDDINGMSLSYINEAAFGRTLSVLRARKENSYYFKTVNEDGVTCLEAVVSLRK